MASNVVIYEPYKSRKPSTAVLHSRLYRARPNIKVLDTSPYHSLRPSWQEGVAISCFNVSDATSADRALAIGQVH